MDWWLETKSYGVDEANSIIVGGKMYPESIGQFELICKTIIKI